MIGRTAADVYAFDIPALERIAAQIGPTVDDLSQAPTSGPGDEYVGRAFRSALVAARETAL